MTTVKTLEQLVMRAAQEDAVATMVEHSDLHVLHVRAICRSADQLVEIRENLMHLGDDLAMVREAIEGRNTRGQASSSEADARGAAPEAGEAVTVTMHPGVTVEEAERRTGTLADRIVRSIAVSLPRIPDEDAWRVYGHDDEPFEGDAPEAWAHFVQAVDRYGFVDRIEEQTDGTWRRRSVRDLLEQAGGDPL